MRSSNNPQRSNKSGYKPYSFDNNTNPSGEEDSTSISSVSGSTAASWSVPRSRSTSGPARNTSDGPRRSGSSFRVSLKPKNRHRHSSRRGISRSSVDDGANDGPGYCRAKNLYWLVLASVLIGTAAQFLEPPTMNRLSQLYDIFDKLSTEDLVAQGEMGTRTFNDDEIPVHNTVGFKADESMPDILQLNSEEAHVEAHDETQGHEMDVALRGSLATSLSLQDAMSNQDSTKLDTPTLMIATEKTYRHVDLLVNETGNRTDWGPSFRPIDDENARVVAYVLPIYSCYKLANQAISQYDLNEPSDDQEFHDAVLMLQASIYQNSVRNINSSSSYDYEMVALLHKSVEQCEGGANRTLILQNLGYRVEIVREPIHQVNIQDEYLKHHAARNHGGRAGMKEMIRLYVFKLVEYKIAVLVDLTTWILRPNDAIFDVLLNGPRNHPWIEQHEAQIVRDNFYPNGTIVTADPLPSEINILYTRDYSSLIQGSWNTGINLNFLPVRPDLQIYRMLIKTYQTAGYDEEWGWERKGYVNYAGSMMTKGLLTYFFNEIMPHRRLELHRCIYNNFADVPYIAGKKGEKDNCRDVKEHKEGPDGKPFPCTDCRIKNWDEISVANFQMCQVPWVCPFVEEIENVPLLIPTLKMCRKFHQSWFALRARVEVSFLQPEERIKPTGTFYPDIFSGYCIPGGPRGGSYMGMRMDLLFPNGFSINRSST